MHSINCHEREIRKNTMTASSPQLWRKRQKENPQDYGSINAVNAFYKLQIVEIYITHFLF